PHVADGEAFADIVGLDEALVDAEPEDQAHLYDEGDAEEKREPSHPGLRAALLEGLVVEAVDGDADQEENGHERDAGEYGVPAVAAEHVGPVRPQHEERGMSDMGNVEQPECHRQPQAYRGIEASQEQSQHDRIEEQLEREQVTSRSKKDG